MQNSVLFLLLLFVMSLVAIPSPSGTSAIKKVDLVTGQITRCNYDDSSRLHGRYTLHDKAGNLLEEGEFDHGACTYYSVNSPDGKMLFEVREDENYLLVQTYP